MLQELAADQLWTADMPASRMGFQFGARMTVVRLSAGELWVHSPIALSPALKQELDTLGPVSHVVAPSKMHYEHLPEFAEAYPGAQLYATPDLKRKPELAGRTALLGIDPDPAWRGTLEQSPIRGSTLFDEVDFYHPASGTLIVTDLLFNIRQNGATAATRFWSAAFGLTGGLVTPRSFGLFARDKRALRESLRAIHAWDFDRVIVTHGEIAEHGGKAAFTRAFQAFL